ncbi:SDR family oxidoreductase [Pseudomonas paraeruginosa]|uniref:SDR family oxidoreductase n=1 Tax=Pseudomonas paraeruginosa TaxID=2994495 RepID=UPI003748FB87
MHNVLIVGASRGIGLGLVARYLDSGARVYAVARRPEDSAGLQALRHASGDRLQLVTGNLDDAQCAGAILRALAEERLDRLVVNAGVYGPADQDVTTIDGAQIAQLFLTNAIAPLRLARVLSGKVREGGVVAFMSSQMASLGLGLSATMPLYGASKATLNSLVRSWQAELGELPFSLLLLHPGWVRTEMGGESAPLSVEESSAGLVAAVEDAAGANACRFVDYRNQPLPW